MSSDSMGFPPIVTRNSGYDALMHATESFIARSHAQVPERSILYQGSNPFSRGLALEAFPFRLSELGIKKQDARTLLNNTLIQTRCIKTNPRPLDDELLSYIEKGF